MLTTNTLTFDQLSAKRRGLRCQVTRKCQHLTDLLHGPSPDKVEIEAQINTVQLHITQLDDIHLNLEHQLPADEIEIELEALEEYRLKFNRVLALQNAKSNAVSVTPVVNPILDTIKLPTLEMDRFDGKYENWVSFWDLYETTIHNNQQLSPITKFKYLRSWLKDEALICIRNCELSVTGYELAIKLLKDEYGKPENIKRLHLKAIHAIEPVSSIDNVTDLRKLEADLRMHLVSLQKNGVNIDDFMIFIIEKIPKLLYQLFRQQHNNNSLMDLLDFIRKETDTIIEWEDARKHSNNKINMSEQIHKHVKVIPTASVLTTNVSGDRRPFTKLFCVICDSHEHGSRVCNANFTLKEKQDKLLAKGRCIRCLRIGHVPSSCDFQMFKCRRCNEEHFQALCPGLCKQNKPEKQSFNNCNVGDVNCYEYLLCTALVNIKHDDKIITTTCLIDSGSQRSVISRQLADILKLKELGKENLTIGVFGGSETTNVYKRVQCDVQGVNVENSILMEALVVEQPSTHKSPAKGVELNQCIDVLKKKGFKLANDYSDIRLLWQIVTGTTEKISESVIAAETVFGWTITGKISKIGRSNCNHISCNNLSVECCSKNIEEKVDTLWEFEALNMLDNEKQQISESQFITAFNETTKFNNKRYSVNLPWKTEMREKLTSNFNNAFFRLRSTVERLKKDQNKFNDYSDNIEAYIVNGHARIIEYDDLESQKLIGCYIPHQGVYSETRSTKTRIVFDASTRPLGQLALNDCIDPGPNRLLDLISMIHKFRSKKFALIGDIKKAFLQIELNESDRDYVRFLWIDRSLSEDEWLLKPVIIQMTRVLFGVSASPTLLKYTIRYHANKYIDTLPEIVEILHNQIYVDDIIAGTDEEHELQMIKEKLIMVLDEASMPLHKVRTNHKIKDDEWNQTNDEDILQKEVSILGINWNLESDQLIVKVPTQLMNPVDKLTKRAIISKASTLFDPMGWLAPLLIRIKMLFQLMWTIGTKWDDEVTPEIEQRWFKWIKMISKTVEWNIPRYLFLNVDIVQLCRKELHIFADASPRAYGAVAYVVTQNSCGHRQSKLIQSKFRVAPIRQVSIPRLELSAATLAAELFVYLNDNTGIKFNGGKIWCDSQITLYWITTQKPRSATFVNNRITKINNLTGTELWDYCPSSENPADLATKNGPNHPLLDSDLWWVGPAWLTDYDLTWKHRMETLSPIDIVDFSVNNLNIPTRTSSYEPSFIDDIEFQKFDDFQQLLCFTVKNQQISDSTLEAADKFLLAEKLWIKSIQNRCFPEEVKRLLKNKKVKPSSIISNLHPAINSEGLIVMQTRLNNREFDSEWVQPYILPSHHYVVHLIVKNVHTTNLHAGLSTTLLLLREKYWVLSARKLVKKCIAECRVCARYTAKHYKQSIPVLPAFRTSDVAPFVHVGIDFAGPIFLYLGDQVVKNYIALFTCSTTRGIHLELAKSLSAEDFILTLRRFTARRGLPSIIYSDNATNFKSTSRKLHHTLSVNDDYQIENYLAEKYIKWHHIVEDAPWWGGHWERMIRSIKEPLRKALGRTTMDTEHFVTLLCEVEAVINNRPLMALHDSPDQVHVITPAELMLGRPLARIENNAQKENLDIDKIYAIRSKFFKHFISM